MVIRLVQTSDRNSIGFSTVVNEKSTHEPLREVTNNNNKSNILPPGTQHSLPRATHRLTLNADIYPSLFPTFSQLGKYRCEYSRFVDMPRKTKKRYSRDAGDAKTKSIVCERLWSPCYNIVLSLTSLFRPFNIRKAIGCRIFPRIIIVLDFNQSITRWRKLAPRVLTNIVNYYDTNTRFLFYLLFFVIRLDCLLHYNNDFELEVSSIFFFHFPLSQVTLWRWPICQI